MKTLNESFTDQEFEQLKQVKDASGYNWHDFFIAIALSKGLVIGVQDNEALFRLWKEVKNK